MPIISRARVLLRLSIVLLTALVVAALAACDSNSAPPPAAAGDTPRQVTVIGNGHVDGTPDTLTTNAAITFVASDVTTAMNQTNERQQAVIDALVNAGVDRKDISTSNVSLQPQYGSDGTAVIGYQASNAIDVTIRDLSSASRVLALIVSTGGNATRINSVNLLDQRRFAVGQGRPVACLQGRQGPRPAVRRPVRAQAGQGHLDLGGPAAPFRPCRCRCRAVRWPRPRGFRSSPASRR